MREAAGGGHSEVDRWAKDGYFAPFGVFRTRSKIGPTNGAAMNDFEQPLSEMTLGDLGRSLAALVAARNGGTVWHNVTKSRINQKGDEWAEPAEVAAEVGATSDGSDTVKAQWAHT
jgi:hypothetical protein